MSLQHCAAPFGFHTPPVEDFGKVYYRGSVNFQMHVPSEWFSNKVYHKEYIFLLEMPNELFYFRFILPLWIMFLKSSTGGVWNLNGVTQTYLLFSGYKKHTSSPYNRCILMSAIAKLEFNLNHKAKLFCLLMNGSFDISAVQCKNAVRALITKHSRYFH